MRILIPFVACALAACVTAPVEPPLPEPDPRLRGQPRWSADETRALVERDVAALLGADVLEEARRAPSAVMVRRPVSLPRMTRQPDGSWTSEPPHVAVAVRTAQGWLTMRADGRFGLDHYAGRELDRLLAARPSWDEPELAEGGCTDPAGISSVVRHEGRSRVATQPCGSSGLTGQIAMIVLAGRVLDWSGVPPDDRPDGIPFRRLDESAASSFTFASGLREPLNLAVRDAPAWAAMWRRITAAHGEPPPPPAIDFGREMLLIAAMGTQPSGGYRIRIERVLDQGGWLEAHVVRVSPGPRCGATAALTHPIDIVRVAASPKPVSWLERDEMADCP